MPSTLVATPGAECHPWRQTGDLCCLTARNFRRVVEDTERTVVVFLCNEGEAVRLRAFAGHVARAVRKRPDLLVAWLGLGARDRASAAPPAAEQQVPRVRVYPKGHKEGLEVGGLSAGQLPSVEQFVAYVMQLDHDHRVPTPPVRWWRECPSNPPLPSTPCRKALPLPLPSPQALQESPSYEQLKDLMFGVRKNEAVTSPSPPRGDYELSPAVVSSPGPAPLAPAATPQRRGSACPGGSSVPATPRPSRSQSQPASSRTLPTAESGNNAANLYGLRVAKCNIPVPPPTGVYRPPKPKRRRFFDL